MKLTIEKFETIDKKLSARKKETFKCGIGVNIWRDIDGETTIFKNKFEICSVEELKQVIEELTMLKEIIEEETGIII